MNAEVFTSNVTRWLDYFISFFHFQQWKVAELVSKFCQMLNIPSKFCPRLSIFCQSGEISPNLGHTVYKVEKCSQFFFNHLFIGWYKKYIINVKNINNNYIKNTSHKAFRLNGGNGVGEVFQPPCNWLQKSTILQNRNFVDSEEEERKMKKWMK